MRLQSLWALLPCLIFVCPVIRGQEYLFAHYSPKDGLVNNRARFMYQDSKGRLYISTFGGMSVYDGSRFINYTTENGLSASLVNDIHELGDDSLLIVPNSRAIHIMVHGVIRNIETADHYFPVTNQLVKCSDGYFYAISDDGFFRWENNRFVKVPLKTANGIEAGPYLIYAVESGGNLFMLTDPLLSSYPGTASLIVYNLRTHRVLTAGKPYTFTALALSPSGEVIINAQNGIYTVDQSAIRADTVRLLPMFQPYAAAGREHCDYMMFDREGDFFVARGKDIIKTDPAGKQTIIGAGDNLPVALISSLFEDRERNLWITYAQSGIARLQSQYIRYYQQNQPDFTVNDLFTRPASDSAWAFDWQGHNLLLITPNSRQVFHSIGPVPQTGHILFGRSAWLVSQNNIYQVHFLEGNRFRLTSEWQDSATVDGWACFDHRDNIVLSSGRLLVYGPGGAAELDVPHLADQVAIDSYDRIWAVTRSNRLLLVQEEASPHGTRLKTVTTWDATPGASPRSVVADHAGHVWVGTRDHGLFCLYFDGLRIRTYRQLTMTNGLSENFVRCLYCDADNTIWAGTASGLDRIEGRNDSFTVSNVAPGHEVSIDKISESAAGIHWALVTGGYFQIPPSPAAKSDYLPKVLFSQVLVGNDAVPYVPGRTLSLPYDRNALSFYVSVPSFTDEGHARYSWLLDGSSEAQWSTPSNQTAINFVNLPPGDYVLRVKAHFLSGIYPDETGAFAFRIRPPWWQTVPFRAVMALLLAAAVAWAIRSYTGKRLRAQRLVLERQKAIEKERSRIATDMHDDLGAGLSRIKFLSDTIGIKQQRQQPIDEEITGIGEYSREMIDKMGEIVWALNQKNDLLTDLLSYTRSYAAAYLMQAGIRSRIDAPEELPNRFVSGEFRRNVYLAVKETLHNIVKHSQAQEVTIKMELNKNLVIVLQDDGVGFDRGNVRPFANGLLNMEQRIRELGGVLKIESRRSGDRTREAGTDRMPEAGTDRMREAGTGRKPEVGGDKKSGAGREGTTVTITVPI